MRKLYFLLPGTTNKFSCGGLWAELKTLQLAQQICQAEVVTYRQREDEKLFLDDLIAKKQLDDVIFVMSWGFDVAKLGNKLKSYHVIYHSHSAGYGFKLPPSIPIITVSRSSLGYWGQLAPHSLIYYLPNQISDEFVNLNRERDLDILVQARKSSEYLLNELVPTLKQKYKVFVVDSYVEDLTGLFNRSKVYLYDSAEYWAQRKVTEGFGLQPMEALACGCQVFSSVNGGLSDYLDPGFNCYKIAGYSQEYDVKRISQVINSQVKFAVDEDFFQEYRKDNIVRRLKLILEELNDFFDHQQQYPSNIKALTSLRRGKLFIKRISSKLQKNAAKN
ncbi:glycosyltransferase [Calothrix sp. PCC 6303]|uniref:glycosyltransferase n=1 Tax=Calothrix sp. PCC 6303 TaxID=1170562 RepID=UPI0002A04263|nr:glycosyltransferase [Calothrix sp. PCC 6303]AFZ03779.1 glycosyl transferase, group 1 [Calothrix sp. PCC 6303]